MPVETNEPQLTDPDAVKAASVADEIARANKVRTSVNLAITVGAGLAALLAFQSLSTSRTASRLETACASILNVVNPHGSTFEKHGSSLSAGDQVVRMLYSVNLPDGPAKRVIILCAFDNRTMSGGLPPLAAVSLNGHQLGPARLSFLNRFWLRSDEASAGLPAGAATPPAQIGIKATTNSG